MRTTVQMHEWIMSEITVKARYGQKAKHTNKWKFKEKYITMCQSKCDRTQNFISNHENVVL